MRFISVTYLHLIFTQIYYKSIFFYIIKSLGELGPASPGLGQVSGVKERLKRYLQIVHQ